MMEQTGSSYTSLRSSSDRVLVFDQCPLFREGLVNILQNMDEFDVAYVTSDVHHIMEQISERHIDFAVLDLDSGVVALDLLQKIKERFKHCRCVMTITDGGRQELMAAIRMQADGFLTKRLEAGEFEKQFRQIRSGDMIISDTLTNALAMALRNVPYPDDSREVSVLSPREMEVLKCIASGMSNRAIAEQLKITDGTVKVHVKHMLKKLVFESRVEAALWASRNGHKNL